MEKLTIDKKVISGFSRAYHNEYDKYFRKTYYKAEFTALESKSFKVFWNFIKISFAAWIIGSVICILLFVKFVISGSTNLDLLFFPGLTLFLVAIFFFIKYSSKRISDIVELGAYYLKEDICGKVWTVPGGEDSDTNFATFKSDNEKHALHFTFSPYYHNTALPELKHEDRFTLPKPEEKCYLLFTNGHELLYVFKGSIWDIDKSDFSLVNGVYIPTSDNTN